MLHIADARAEAIKAAGVEKVDLLGTRFTMEEDFYKNRLIGKYGLDVIIPTSTEMEAVHQIINEKLWAGKIISSSIQTD